MRISQTEKLKLRERILTEALSSLKLKGANGVSVDELMRNLGLTSGALYSHFKSKNDLFQQVVQKELDRLIAHHQSQIERLGVRALADFVDSYLVDGHIDSIQRGCIFAALGADLQRQKPNVRKKFGAKMQDLFETMASGSVQLSPTVRLAKVHFVFSSLVGSLVLARSLQNSKMQSQILNTAKNQLLNFIQKEWR